MQEYWVNVYENPFIKDELSYVNTDLYDYRLGKPLYRIHVKMKPSKEEIVLKALINEAGRVILSKIPEVYNSIKPIGILDGYRS